MFGHTNSQNLINTGNDTFDRFLGGGFLNSTVNLFERTGPSSKILDPILFKSVASTSLCKKNNLLLVNFNSITEFSNKDFLNTLPAVRQVKSDVLYKDIRGSSATAKIKIAWRYSQRGTCSPSDNSQGVNQIDFGLALKKETTPESLGQMKIINIMYDDALATILTRIDEAILQMKSSDASLTVIIKDILHPFSPILDKEDVFIKFLYSLRCLARKLENGAIIMGYDIQMCQNHDAIKHQIYSLMDSVVSFHSYETDQNKMTGYKDIDGTLCYVKVPKINSYGFHFQYELSDWGYRITKNGRFFVVDELSLPPCEDNDSDNNSCHSKHRMEVLQIENNTTPLERANPLEELRQVARDILPRKIS